MDGAGRVARVLNAEDEGLLPLNEGGCIKGSTLREPTRSKVYITAG